MLLFHMLIHLFSLLLLRLVCLFIALYLMEKQIIGVLRWRCLTLLFSHRPFFLSHFGSEEEIFEPAEFLGHSSHEPLGLLQFVVDFPHVFILDFVQLLLVLLDKGLVGLDVLQGLVLSPEYLFVEFFQFLNFLLIHCYL